MNQLTHTIKKQEQQSRAKSLLLKSRKKGVVTKFDEALRDILAGRCVPHADYILNQSAIELTP